MAPKGESPLQPHAKLPIIEQTALERGDPEARQQLFDSLRGSYARIRLSANVLAAVDAMQSEAMRWFTTASSAQKQQFSLPANNWLWGYHDRLDDLGKELLQIRLHGGATEDVTAAWPAEEAKFKQLWTQVHQSLKSLAQLCLYRIGEVLCKRATASGPEAVKALDVSPAAGAASDGANETTAGEKAAAATAPPVDPAALEKWKKLSGPAEYFGDATKLDIFHYKQAPSPLHSACAAHTDSSLLTLIPPQLGKPGLEVYELLTFSPEQCETEDPNQRGVATLMVGEAMHRASNAYLIPTMHRVEPKEFPRLSCPLLLFPDPLAELDMSILDPELVGDDRYPQAPRQLARDFIGRLRAHDVKASVTFNSQDKGQYDQAVYRLAGVYGPPSTSLASSSSSSSVSASSSSSSSSSDSSEPLSSALPSLSLSPPSGTAAP